MKSYKARGVALAIGLSLTFGLPTVSEAGICQRFLHAAKTLGQEIIETKGTRIFLRETKNPMMVRFGMKIVPTLFVTTVFVSTPVALLIDDYLSEEEELATRMIDVMIDRDIRFDTLREAHRQGTLNQEGARRAAIHLKLLWEKYATRLLNGTDSEDSMRQDLALAERGDFPFQELYPLFSKGIPVESGKKYLPLTTDEKRELIRITHQYNLRLILINVYADRDPQTWQKLKQSFPNLKSELAKLEQDNFVVQVARLGHARPELFFKAYRILQEDSLNLFSLETAKVLNISGMDVPLKDLREELLSENNLQIKF